MFRVGYNMFLVFLSYWFKSTTGSIDVVSGMLTLFVSLFFSVKKEMAYNGYP